MSVKLLSNDAKQLFEQRVLELQNYIRGFGEGFQEKTGLAFGSGNHRERLKSFLFSEKERQRQLYEIQKQVNMGESIKELQGWLEKPEFWQKTNEEVISIKCSPAWMKEFFKKEIDGSLFLCCNAFFVVKGLYSEEEAKLLVRDKIRKSKSVVNYLKFRQETPEADLEYERLPIPETVRNEVWRRDKGKCVQCKSVRNLEFDHIVPVSKGGSNTARNIQLLCETCNRQKSDSIG